MRAGVTAGSWLLPLLARGPRAETSPGTSLSGVPFLRRQALFVSKPFFQSNQTSHAWRLHLGMHAGDVLHPGCEQGRCSRHRRPSFCFPGASKGPVA